MKGLKEALSLFGIGECREFSELNAGHINRTFLCRCGGRKYVVQSLNREVFSSPETVMGNVARIGRVFAESPDENVSVPHFLSFGGRNYAELDGRIWRTYEYIPTAENFLTNRNYAAGYAFGVYMRKINADGVALGTTIENFHSFSSYFERLTELLKNCGKKVPDSKAVSRLDSLNRELSEVFTADLPRRNVHNDAKSANVIFGEKLVVIDLDTSMEGYAANDFGDLIRSVCSGVSGDISAIGEAASGFAAGTSGILSAKETDSLYYGILYNTGELAMRYLIDYIGEEGYFKGKTPDDCFERARELLAQLDAFTEFEATIKELIKSAFLRQHRTKYA